MCVVHETEIKREYKSNPSSHRNVFCVCHAWQLNESCKENFAVALDLSLEFVAQIQETQALIIIPVTHEANLFFLSFISRLSVS